jgi:hypothetical protein
MNAIIVSALLASVAVAGQGKARPELDDPAPMFQLVLETTLPPLGAFDPAKDKVVVPKIGRTDLKAYADDGDKKGAEAREQVAKARALLWAVTLAPAPKAYAAEVAKERKALNTAATLALSYVAIPRDAKAEAGLKKRVAAAGMSLARIVSRIERDLDALAELQEKRDDYGPRLRAHLDLVHAALILRLAHLEEFGNALGTMRKESPPSEAKDKWYRLAARDRVGDASAKKLVREAGKRLQRLEKEHPGTIWEAAAEQMKKTALGAEWRSEP